MNRRNHIKIVLISLLLAVIFIVGGCRTAAQKPQGNIPNTPAPVNPTVPNIPGSTPTYSTELANMIATEAGNVSGVTKANVLVIDKSIYVGLELQENMDKTSIEKSVSDKIKNMQPRYAVSVTSDPNIVNKIKNINNGLAQGMPIDSFSNDIQMIGNILTPKA